MKIALVSSYVPFVKGGARFIVEWLEPKLREQGHSVERFYLPFSDRPEHLFDQIAAYRLMDLTGSCDRLIAFRPPAYVLPHPNKVLWFIHHIRGFYDLWGTAYQAVPGGPKGQAVRQALIDIDTRTIAEARRVYTNSQVVADRLKRFNGIAAAPLYPPIFEPERFHNGGYGDEIVVVCRIEPHKRQHLLVEAMRHVTTGVKLRLCGQSSSADYSRQIRQTIRRYSLDDKIILEDRWIDEDEKVARLSGALAVAYMPQDEDSYGYPSLEGAHSRKAILTAHDSGGVLELVEDERNGLVVDPEPQAIAQAFDRLFEDRTFAARMGLANEHRVAELKIDWSTVVDKLTQ